MRFTAEQLGRASLSLFVAAGVPEDTAAQVSESLVQGNLMGHDSHGVIRIVQYLQALAQGQIDPHAEIEVLKETPTTALLDAHWAFGQVAAARGMDMAMAKAKANQVAAVGIARCFHIGRLGEYALTAAEQGLVGAVMCNVSRMAGGAPFGGTARTLGTNPIAYAVPAGGGRKPFLMDFATTACAEGKLRVARARGVPVPEGWLLDKEGRPTTDPAAFYDGGAILPAGAHKGYGLGLLMDILGGALTGHGCGCLPEYVRGNGVLMMALDIAAFRPLVEFEDTVDRLFERVKSGPTAPGHDEILIPGEPEFRAMEARLREGIELPESTWQELLQAANKLGVPLETL